MKRRFLSGALLVAMTAISACVETVSSSPQVNDRARAVQSSEEFVADLESVDRQLQACIIYSYLLQEERGLEPRESVIRFACEEQEIAYRAAVMDGVRKEWQSQTSVLNNTANAATNTIYRSTIKELGN